MKNQIRQLHKFLLAFGLFSMLLLLSLQAASAQSKSFYWEDWVVEMTVLENGDMLVTESQTLNFSGAPFTFGFRAIPTGSAGNNDGITDVSVREGDRVYRESGSNEPYTFEVTSSGDETRIDWFFEPALGRQTYTFSYRVLGATRVGTLEQGDGDQIFWKVIPPDHPSYVANTTAVIRLPDGIEPQRYFDTNEFLVAGYINDVEESNVTTSVNGSVITYEYPFTLPADTSLAARVQWPHGLLSIETPNWQARQQQADVIGLVIGALSALLCLGGPLAVIVLWYLRGRDPEAGIVMPDYISEPPSNLPPAVAGTLVDEKADMQDIISTLVDLARRGYLVMGEESKNEHSFTRTDKSDKDLRPFERRFLKDLFGNKQEVSLDSLRYKFHSKLPGLRSLLYEELVDNGFVQRSPETVRRMYGGLAVGVIVLAGVSLFGMLFLFDSAIGTLLCPPFALGITGLVLAYTSRHMPKKTHKGAEQSAQWTAFKKYLQDVEKYSDLEQSGDIFDRYLPYAVAFGLERSWIRKFSSIPTTPIPGWYLPYPFYGYYGHHGHGSRPSSSGGGMQVPTLEGMSGSLTGGLAGMSAGLTRMLSSTSTVLKSTPPSSSGSSGGFSGGFSGGGFSGGGGSAGFG